MPERFIQAVFTDDPAAEEPAETRKRLKERFPPGGTRRMTQLGMLVGGVVGQTDLQNDDAVVYATSYGESRALESYLDSFPHPSPTLFQTSIHPSGVQQGLIGRKFHVGELYPLSGSRLLSAQALAVTMVSPASRVCLCGGEERGTWLRESQAASERSFGFALMLAATPRPDTDLGSIVLGQTADSGNMPLANFFDLLHRREAFSGVIGCGLHLRLSWS